MKNNLNHNQRFYWLDLIRFSAAFIVFASHYRGAFFVEYGLLPSYQQNFLTQIFYFVTRLGEESVLVFFVLSGFLVGGKSIDRIIHNKVNVRSYALDRAVRIFLPLIASIFLVIIIDIYLGIQIPFLQIIGSIFSLQGIITDNYTNAPLWSLSYEVWFYILMGAIMILYNRKMNNIISIFLIALVLIIFTKLEAKYLFVWFIGAFAYQIRHVLILKGKWMGFALCILITGCIILTQLLSSSRSFTTAFSNLPTAPFQLVMALFTSLFFINVSYAKPTSFTAQLVEISGSKLSKFSYSLYLAHYPLLAVLSYWGFSKSPSINLQSFSRYFVTLLIGLCAGYFLYLIAEKHTDRIKPYFNPSKKI